MSLLVALALGAGEPTSGADFSGIYTLKQRQPSRLEQPTLVIAQQGNRLDLTLTRPDPSGARSRSFSYVADAQARSTTALQGGSRAATARWADPDTLVVDTEGKRRRLVETWRLEGDVLTLEIRRAGPRRSLTRTLVFER